MSVRNDRTQHLSIAELKLIKVHNEGQPIRLLLLFFCFFWQHSFYGKVEAKLRNSVLTRGTLAVMFAFFPVFATAAAAPGTMAASVVPPGSERALLQQVAKIYQAQPVNARIDPVWKLIPALNGASLNVPKTLVGWNKKDPLTTPLVFDQVPATVATDAFVAPIYRGNPMKRQMALMFNVAWGEDYLPKILTTLKQYHVKATFFIDGKWASTHQSQLREIAKAGMELGNHGYRHHLFGSLAKAQMQTDLTLTNTIVQNVTGITPVLFAPPAGDYNALAVKVASTLGMKTVLWTVDTVDWRRPQPEVIAMRVLMKKSPGALVLMHPTAPTAAALPVLIDNLQKAGYQLVSVSDLLSPTRSLPKILKEALASLRSSQ